MTQEQKELLTYIHYTLEMNVNDKSKTYEYSIEEAEKVTTLEVNREEHLEEIMRWALQELEKHFELIPEPEAEDETTEDKVKQLLEFRKQFTPREWQEINHIIDSQFKKKAAKLQLDDHDIQEINEIIKRQKIVYPKIDNTKSKSLMDIANHDLKDV